MQKRFISIWFRSLHTDWFCRKQPGLRNIPFVLASPDHGRMVISSVNQVAQIHGVNTGMVVADARAIVPSLQVLDDKPELTTTLLKGLGGWCIRYTPGVALDPPAGLILDVTGCAHLWGGEKIYLTAIISRFKQFGYDVRATIADTIGAAWAMARFGEDIIIESGRQTAALLSFPASALRIEQAIAQRLEKLGLRKVKDFINMPRSALRRRFGQQFLQRLHQALGDEEEVIVPLHPIEPYQERLPALEPIVTLTGIEIGLERLLTALCHRLQQEEKGLRKVSFTCYRIDGKIEKIEIGTGRPSCNPRHLFKLFENKLGSIEPALGIELFVLEALKVEDLLPVQEKLWQKSAGLDDIGLSELLDRLSCKIGATNIHRYLPDEHYWPERSFKLAADLWETPSTSWKVNRPRPLQLLSKPELIEVTAPIPDYPPMLFRHKGKIHKIIKADGPERIEQEWWLQEGQHRDYYYVEDEHGNRYWLFRLGHYDVDKTYQWFIHGFFA